MTLALEGIKVIELTRVAPGPYCCMILGDLGADIIRVEEPPQAGLRGVPMSPERARSLEQTNMAHNRNKKSIILNLKNEDAKKIFYKLAEKADAVVEGFRPGVAQRLGIDYETLRQLNPGLIYCSVTGYGQDGPYRLLPGHDINYISFAGALALIGEPGGKPVIPLNILGDYAGGGMHAAIGILAALMARNKTGKGQMVDIALCDGVISLLEAVVSDYYLKGEIIARGENMLNGGLPCYAVYETKDGKFISFGCNEPHFWANLCRELGREDFIPHQYTAGEKRKEIFEYFNKKLMTKTRDEWFELLKDKEICIGKVYTTDELASDPQVKHRQMIVDIPHPRLGKITQAGISVKLSDTPGRIRSHPPSPGENTDEILKKIGYSEKDVAGLRQSGALG